MMGAPGSARAWRFRVAGTVILLLGFAAANTVYWLRSRGPDFSTDPSMSAFNRPEERQLGILYGKQGKLIEDLDDSLKRPGTQAILILIVTGIVAAGCFRFAWILEDEAKQPAGKVLGRE